MIVGIPDKKLSKQFLEGKEYMMAADEGEAVAIAGGYWLATKERATAFMSADGLCNALNFITSWIIPDEVEMNLVISTGRQEPPHKVMSDIVEDLIKLLPYDSKRISIQIIR